jgi:hypothetical protein
LNRAEGALELHPPIITLLGGVLGDGELPRLR